MTFAFFIVGGLIGTLVAVGAFLAAGLGPVATLMIFWLAGMAVTLALAIDFNKKTSAAIVAEESQTPQVQNESGNTEI